MEYINTCISFAVQELGHNNSLALNVGVSNILALSGSSMDASTSQCACIIESNFLSASDTHVLIYK